MIKSVVETTSWHTFYRFTHSTFIQLSPFSSSKENSTFQ